MSRVTHPIKRRKPMVCEPYILCLSVRKDDESLSVFMPSEPAYNSNGKTLPKIDWTINRFRQSQKEQSKINKIVRDITDRIAYLIAKILNECNLGEDNFQHLLQIYERTLFTNRNSYYVTISYHKEDINNDENDNAYNVQITMKEWNSLYSMRIDLNHLPISRKTLNRILRDFRNKIVKYEKYCITECNT